MTYNQLPQTIISPFTGKKLYLMPIGFPNEVEYVDVKNQVYTTYDEGQPEWYDGPVAMYRDCRDRNVYNCETIYVPFK